MPIGIDHAASKRVVYGFQELILTIAMYEGGSMTASHMKDILVRIGTIGGMAVDALVRCLGILQQGALVEIGQVALVEAHLAIDLVAGWDAAVGDAPGIEGFVAHHDLEVAIAGPLPLFLCTDGECQRSAFVLLYDLMPLVDVEVGIVSVGVNSASLRAFHLYVDSLHLVVCHREVEWRNAHRDGDAYIVGIDIRQLVLLGCISRLGVTSCEE